MKTSIQKFSLRYENTEFSGLQGVLIYFLSSALSIFVLTINVFPLTDILTRSAIFMGFLTVITFLTKQLPSRKFKAKFFVWTWLPATLSLLVSICLIASFDQIIARNLELTTTNVLVGILTMIIVFESGRRSLGFWLPALCLIFVLYALFGQLLPSPWGHFGVRFERLLLRLVYTSEGLFGSVFQIAQSYIGLFVLFGAILSATGATSALTNMGIYFSGGLVGGPAKVAIFASGFTGMISGSAAANVATTGTLTIPMMKRVGFPSSFSGAVEAIASTGGLITPPIMGAAAFLMAEFLGVSYLTILTAAIVPACLYYASLYFLIDLRARMLGIGGLEKHEIPVLRDVILKQGHLFIPIFVLIYFLLQGYTPIYAAIYGIVSSIFCSFIRKNSRLTPKKALLCLMEGGLGIVTVGMACLLAGIIVCVISLTGVAQVFTSYIDILSNGSLFLALIYTAIASILLSCALPATAVYIVVAITIAPALINLGAEPLAAHFFVFWFGVLSNITPPVAIACFTAAGIARAPVGEIATNAMKMAVPALTIPFLLIYTPIFLGLAWSIEQFSLNLLFVVIGFSLYIIGSEGFFIRKMSTLSRVILIISSLIIFSSGLKLELVLVAIILSLLGMKNEIIYLIKKKRGFR